MGCFTWIRGLKMQFPFKDKELNKIAALFNVSTFLLTCAAIVQPSWFRIKGLHCTLSLTQFFSFDDDDDDEDDNQITISQNLRGLKMQFPFKDKELNKIAALFNVSTFLLTCAAIVQPSWFRIKGLHCTLSLTQFFSFDDDDDDEDDNQITISQNLRGLPSCTTPETITLMKVLILLCFMVLLCSCIGTLINLTSLNSRAIKMLRRNAVPSIMCVFWVIAIVGVCYYTTVALGNVNNSDPDSIQVDYEYGFYTITGAGALALLASAANLWGAPLSNDEDYQRRNLMEDWDGYEAHSVGPTPAVPTLPPYTPSSDYVPTLHPPYAPPVLGAQQYFPFDDLSVLPPPPPYSP